jgi:hypothetical protein
LGVVEHLDEGLVELGDASRAGVPAGATMPKNTLTS